MNPTGFEKVESAAETCFLQVGQRDGVGNCRKFIGRESEIVPIVRVIEQIETPGKSNWRLRCSPSLMLFGKAGIHVESTGLHGGRCRQQAGSCPSNSTWMMPRTMLETLLAESITGANCVPESRFFGSKLVTTSAPAILPPPRFNIVASPKPRRNGRADPNCRIGEASRPNGRCEVAGNCKVMTLIVERRSEFLPTRADFCGSRG